MLELRPGTISPARQVDFVELAFGDVTCGPLSGVCPNCGGNFERRPMRPAAALAKHPASTVRVFAPEGCA